MTELSSVLRTAHLGRLVVHRRSIDSTNDLALVLSKRDAAHGLAVVADQQTAGRGQRGRRWRSEPGTGLYVSFVLRTGLPPARAAMTTLAAGVAVRAALAPLVDVDLGLKWPNDVMVKSAGEHYGRKLAGILFEATSDADTVHHAVLGIGVNLKRPSDPALSGFATSLEALGAEATMNLGVMARIANALEPWLERLEDGEWSMVTDAWTRAAIGLGQTVEIRQGDRIQRGTLRGLSSDGAILLATATGTNQVYHGRLALPDAPVAPELA